MFLYGPVQSVRSCTIYAICRRLPGPRLNHSCITILTDNKKVKMQMFNAYLFCINHKFSSEDLGEYFKKNIAQYL